MCDKFTIKRHVVKPVTQKRKYKEPNDLLFTDFKEHLFKLKHEYHSRYYNVNKIICKKEDFDFINTLDDEKTIFAKHKTIGKYYAIKVISKLTIISYKRLNEIKNQKRIEQAVRFSFIYNMEYNFKDDAYIYFVYAYSANEDMFSYLQRFKFIPEESAKFYGAQILLALEYLHNINIIHRNIKSENIAFMPNGYVKLGNFRFAKFTDKRTYTFCGTLEYVAPELILCKGYGKSVDWWAYGIFLYEIIAGYTPFLASEPEKICANIVKGKLHFNYNFSDLCKDLLKNMLHKTICQRYGNLLNGSLDIKCHEWYNVINWQKIYDQTLNPPYIPDAQFKTYDPKKLETVLSTKIDDINVYDKEFEDF